VSGFVDGDGNFSIVFRKYKNTRTGWSVQATFQIKLHKKDIALLESIQASLGAAGNIYDLNDGFARYMVVSMQDITTKIIPHFLKYPLITQKRADFELFKNHKWLRLWLKKSI
jgi:hypothetical protein